MGAVAVIELELGRRHHRSPSATLTRQHPTADHRRCRPSSLAGTAATDALTPAFASGPSLPVATATPRSAVVLIVHEPKKVGTLISLHIATATAALSPSLSLVSRSRATTTTGSRAMTVGGRRQAAAQRRRQASAALKIDGAFVEAVL